MKKNNVVIIVSFMFNHSRRFKTMCIVIYTTYILQTILILILKQFMLIMKKSIKLKIKKEAKIIKIRSFSQ